MTTVFAPKTGLGPSEARLLERLQRSSRAVVRLRRDGHLFEGFEPNALRLTLKGLADGGWLRRIERGVYVVGTTRGLEAHSQLAILTDWLDGERYVVTGFFALAHWNLTGHPPTTIDVLIDRRRPNVTYGRTLFRFIYVPADRQPAHREVRAPGAMTLARMVTPEGALMDVLAGRHATTLDTATEAFRRGMRYGVIQRRRLASVARRGPATAARRLGWIAEHEGDPLAALLRPLVGNDGYVPLDPGSSAAGARRNVAWRLLENIEAA